MIMRYIHGRMTMFIYILLICVTNVLFTDSVDSYIGTWINLWVRILFRNPVGNLWFGGILQHIAITYNIHWKSIVVFSVMVRILFEVHIQYSKNTIAPGFRCYSTVVDKWYMIDEDMYIQWPVTYIVIA